MPNDMTMPDNFLAKPLTGLVLDGPRVITLRFRSNPSEDEQTLLSWINQEITSQTSGKGLTRVLMRTQMPVVAPVDKQCCCNSPTADELTTSLKDTVSVHVVVTIPKSATDKRVVGVNRLSLSACIQATTSLLAEAFSNLIPIHTGVDIQRFKRMAETAGFGIDSQDDWDMINTWAELVGYLQTHYSNTPGADDMLSFIVAAINGFESGSASQQQSASLADSNDGRLEVSGSTGAATDLLSYLALGMDITEPIKGLQTVGGSFVRPNPNQTSDIVEQTISKMVAISAL